MQFREVTYTQQLKYQRLVHGPEADISERRCVLGQSALGKGGLKDNYALSATGTIMKCSGWRN